MYICIYIYVHIYTHIYIYIHIKYSLDILVPSSNPVVGPRPSNDHRNRSKRVWRRVEKKEGRGERHAISERSRLPANGRNGARLALALTLAGETLHSHWLRSSVARSLARSLARSSPPPFLPRIVSSATSVSYLRVLYVCSFFANYSSFLSLFFFFLFLVCETNLGGEEGEVAYVAISMTIGDDFGRGTETTGGTRTVREINTLRSPPPGVNEYVGRERKQERERERETRVLQLRNKTRSVRYFSRFCPRRLVFSLLRSIDRSNLRHSFVFGGGEAYYY